MISEDLAGLRRLYTGFMGARVVIAANGLGVFDRLRKASSAATVARALKTDFRATEILLDALAGIGLLKKGTDGKYRNTPAADRYLVKGGRLYQGDIIRHAEAMWENFSGLDQVVRTGLPAKRGRQHQGRPHEAFIMGMHNLTVLRTDSLVKAIGLKGVRRCLTSAGDPAQTPSQWPGKA